MAVDADTERRLKALEKRVRSLEQAAAAAATAASEPSQAVPFAPPAPPAWIPVDSPAPQPALAPRPGPASAPGSRSATRGGLGGANWLAYAGMIVLALGIVFFLKLAYDRGWVPIPGRYAIGIAAGLALWALGDALRKRVDVRFAQVLAGGGAVIAYVTLYVGYASPAYREALHMSLGLELVLLAATSLALAGYAMWRDWPVVGIVAAGLATILLAPAGDFSTIGVAYAALLDTAILLAAAWRGWPQVVASAGIAANVALVAGLATDAQWQVLLACILTVNGAVMVAASRVRQLPAFASVEAGLALVLAAIEAGAALDAGGVRDAYAWSILAAGAAGLLSSLVARRAAPGLAVAGAVLTLLWPGVHFDRQVLAIIAYGCLGVLGLVLAQVPVLRPGGRVGASVGTLVACAAGLLMLLGGGFDDDLFDRERALALVASGLLAGVAVVHWALARRSAPRELAFVSIGEALATPLIVCGFLLSGWVITVSWAVLGLLVVVAGLAGRLGEMRVASFAVFGLVLVRIFIFDLAALSLVGRVLAFLVTGALLLVAAFLYARNRRTPEA